MYPVITNKEDAVSLARSVFKRLGIDVGNNEFNAEYVDELSYYDSTYKEGINHVHKKKDVVYAGFVNVSGVVPSSGTLQFFAGGEFNCVRVKTTASMKDVFPVVFNYCAHGQSTRDGDCVVHFVGWKITPRH
ncbi:hypothetical protein [Sanyastnella coralliicola]|uniref:hypothetical protein n=1 Tax=Sanyastnella coralliicola TaxID=3069118 RepID=UPI0027B9C2CA|nr:hypothetical protein [Longitalea sp. SCSIO 12813]